MRKLILVLLLLTGCTVSHESALSTFPRAIRTLTPERVCIVTVGALNLRTAPTVNGSDVITWLERGDELSVIGNSGAWIQVSIDEKIGYVRSDYCEVK